MISCVVTLIGVQIKHCVKAEFRTLVAHLYDCNTYGFNNKYCTITIAIGGLSYYGLTTIKLLPTAMYICNILFG